MSKTPIVRPISWMNAAINLVVLCVFVLVGWFFDRSVGVMVGALAYLLLSYLLRRVFCRHHRSAIAHCKRQEFEQAIPEFQRSLDFFQDNRWLDDFRAITMLSSSGMCYREMALVSLAFCYGQIGDGKNSRSNYERCLQLFPDNEIAQSALRFMDSAITLGLTEDAADGTVLGDETVKENS